MFRPNPKKLAEEASKEIGLRLRKLCKTYDDKIMLAEATGFQRPTHLPTEPILNLHNNDTSILL